MIRDSAHHTFDVVICWKHDRFARNRYDAAKYKAKLKANGVSILYAREEVPEGAQGIIIDSILEGFAEYYSANLSENVKRGLYESALKRQTMGVTLFGYKEDENHRYVPDENAPIVKRIFQEYASGMSAKEIYSRLNAEGFRTMRGKPFVKSSVVRVITNPKYKGVYQYADIYDEKGVPPIVSSELWDEANARVSEHASAPARKYEEHLLTGKLFCGHCGKMMTAGSGTSKTGKRYDYYTCNGRRLHQCEKKNEPKQPLEDAVISTLRDLVFSDEFIERVTDYFMEWQEKDEDSLTLQGMKDNLARCERAISNLEKSQEVGFSETVARRLIELEGERKSISKEIDQYILLNPTFTRAQILAFLRSFREGDIQSPRWRSFLVRSFLKAVYCYDDKLVLHLNINGEGETLTLPQVNEACAEGSGLNASAPPNVANSNLVYWKGSVLAIVKHRG